MPNPYLTLQSPPFDPGDYGLTVFQPDMVLTAGQLNQLFGFLLSQEQQTRTRLLGVGVACGLVPGRAPDGASLAVTAGCGVTTEGHLLSLPADGAYTRYATFDQGAHAAYPPFQVVSGLQLWEVFPALAPGAAPPPGAPATAPLAGFDLADKVVLLYLESAVQAADECTGVACDNKGDAYHNRLHVLLCRQPDADALIQAQHREAAAAYAQLPVLPLARVHLDARRYTASLGTFQGFIDRAARALARGLGEAHALVQHVPGIGPPTAWATTLVRKAHEASRDAFIQYAYDWLKDLHDAYEEFRLATAQWLVACLPAEGAFPQHLLLGELVPAAGRCQPQYRHAWLRSPAVAAAPDARARAAWLWQRLGRLIEDFDVPAAPGPVRGKEFKTPVLPARADALRLTPDHARPAPFDQRSLPFYYHPRLRNFWSYDKARTCRTSHVLSYHAAVAGAPPQAADPLRFQVEPFSFYRIEGLLHAPAPDALTRLLQLRRQHNLAFDVVALRADDQQRLLADQLPDADFADLQFDFDALLAEIQCEEASLRGHVKAFAALQVALPMPKAVFLDRLTPYELRLQPLLGQLPAARCIKDRLLLLLRLHAAYWRRRTDLEDALTFGPFLQANPGLEHGAGVPRGGTFVLVYRTEATLPQQGGKLPLGGRKGVAPKGSLPSGGAPKGGVPLVVADFYLPYRVSGRGLAVQVVLPPAPASLALPTTRFCLHDAPSPLTATPAGGTFGNEPLVSRQGAQFFFNPTAVGRRTLAYTAPDGQTATLDVEVLARPTARFSFKADPSGAVLFANESADATEVTWEFGDGSAPERLVLPGEANGATRHQFTLQADGSGKFTARLSASNGICSTTSPPQTIEFQPRPVPAIKALGAVCFNTEHQLAATPAGGTFTAKTLPLSAKGLLKATVPGPHTVTYAVGGATATTQVFVLPGDFVVDKVEEKSPGKFRVEALVLTVPEKVTCEWQLNGKPVKLLSPPKAEGANSRFVLELVLQPTTGPLPPLTLTLRKPDGSACPTISRPFLGKP